MRPKKLKAPRLLLQTKFSLKIFLWLLGSTCLSLVFISMSIISGVTASTKKNIIRNYNSHLSVKSSTYNMNNFKNLSSWWSDPQSTLEQPLEKNFIRAITTRSTISAIYTKDQELEKGVQLIIIDRQDSDVFDNFMSYDTIKTSVPLNEVFIGQDLANLFDLKKGDPFPITIPSFYSTLSNITIGYIFNSPDRFYNSYGVYINKNTMNNIIGEAFQQYHIRFSATPFIPLIISNISSYIKGQEQKQEDDLLTYQYKILSLITNNIKIWAYAFYSIFGILFFLGAYLVYYRIKEDLDQYTYREGSVPQITITKKILLTSFYQLLGISFGALIILAIFLFINPSIISSWLTSSTGIFQNFSLSIPYYFSPTLPIYYLLETIFWGIIIGMLSCSLSIYIYNKLVVFLDPKNKISYIILGMLFIVILGYLSSHSYLYNSFAQKGKEKFWQDTIFGVYSLYDKNYLEDSFLQIPPSSFTIDPDLLTILQEKGIPYLTSLETYGTASTTTNNIIVQSKDVTIKSLTGTISQSQYSNILPALLSNQILIGKNIADYFLTNKVLNLTLENRNATKIQTSIFVHDVIDIPFGDFNNTIFMNQNTLVNSLQLTPYHITKLQVPRGKKYLKNHTNNSILMASAQESYHSWNILSNLYLISLFSSSMMIILAFAFLIMLIFLYFCIHNKQKLIHYYFLGIPYHPVKIYGQIAIGSFILGTVISWITKLIFLITSSQTPSFLLLDNLVPTELTFSIDYLALPLLSLGILFIGLLLHLILLKLLQKIQKNLIIYYFKDKNS